MRKKEYKKRDKIVIYLDQELKNQVFAFVDSMELTVGQVLRTALIRMVNEQKIPFSMLHEGSAT